MTVYFMAFIHEVTSMEGLGEYAQLGVATIERSRGKRLAAGLRGEGIASAGSNRVIGAETIEGEPAAGVSLLSFPDRQAFDDWYYSDEYQKALKIRKASARTQNSAARFACGVRKANRFAPE